MRAKKAPKAAEPPVEVIPQPEPEPWVLAVRAAEEKKATDIKILDLTGMTSFTDHFIVCTGANPRQMDAIADAIGLALKKAGQLPISVEGASGSEWVLCDYGDFIVHIFTPKAREYYELERLWKQAKLLTLPPA